MRIIQILSNALQGQQMYKVEWLGKGETGEGWIKVLALENITEFMVETLNAGGIILKITKA